MRRAMAVKAQMEAAFKAMQVLKREREQRGIRLNELAERAERAERAGIDKANLSCLWRTTSTPTRLWRRWCGSPARSVGNSSSASAARRDLAL